MRRIEYTLFVNHWRWPHPMWAIGASHVRKRTVDINLSKIAKCKNIIRAVETVLSHETLHVVCGDRVPESIIRSLNGEEFTKKEQQLYVEVESWRRKRN